VARYEFELATEADDGELRRILAATPMPGTISVTFQREPSYFAAAVVDGSFRQAIVCRDGVEKRIAGFCSRSVRTRYVNGDPQPVGYLSLLRLLPQHRNIGLVARGYKYIRQLHRDGRTELYLTTIAKGNELAISTLTSARTHLPRYYPAGDYHTVVIPVAQRLTNKSAKSGVSVRGATPADLEKILQLLARIGPSRQFFPKYDAADFFEPQGTFKDLVPADLLLAFRSGQLVGVLGGWDQHRFRQTVVERLDAPLRWWRPVYNAFAMLRGRPKLPKPGERFGFVTGVLPVVENDDPNVFAVLLNTLLARLAARQQKYLLLGMHETDPLLKLVLHRATTSYLTHVYYVCWADGEAILRSLDDRPPYLELGCL
jgi:hypothetical protein